MTSPVHNGLDGELRPGELWPDPSAACRVLLIRLRSIGDTVLMTPCLRALKDWRPQLQVAVLSERLAAPLLEDHPLVDKLIITGGSTGARLRLVSQLRRERFDIAFNMHGGTTATILAALSGARHTVGYAGYRHSRLLGNRAPAPDLIIGRPTLHSVEQQLALLHWAGVPWPEARPQLSLAISATASRRVCERLADIGICNAGGGGGYAVIAPAAALESKRWPARNFAAVADHLGERWSLPSVVIAGPGQEGIAREVADGARPHAKALAGLSLKELAALLERARVFIGNDSGPMHMAAAFSKPVVAVFGSSDPAVWHPWTDALYRVVGGGRPITQVATDDVIDAIGEVLQPAPGAFSKADTAWRKPDRRI